MTHVRVEVGKNIRSVVVNLNLMDERQRKILEAIVEAFVTSANPVGSKHLTERYSFDLSSATIRNEMATLEDEGYILQPHTSAGRIPTSRAYRLLVDQMQIDHHLMTRVKSDIEKAKSLYYINRTKERLYDLVSILAGVTKCISFATLPDKTRIFYIGISNLLKNPEFYSQPDKATQVVEVFENKLYDLISELEISDDGAIYIGEENILPEFQSCSLMAIPYHDQGFNGIIGLLGSTRMNYPYNFAALKTALDYLSHQPL